MVVDPNASGANSAKAGPYGRAAGCYLDADWLPIPLRYGKKGPPPAGTTGRKNPYPDGPQARKFVDGFVVERPEDNVGLWLGQVSVGEVTFDVLGIDVDHYADSDKIKTGAVQLEKLEDELGPLPATWISTSRGADNSSGIRFFRVPEGLAWNGRADSYIDIIQIVHRYAVVWPSKVDGRRYQWFDPEGVQRNTIPDPAKLPELPPGWVDYLTENRRKARDGVKLDLGLSTKQLTEWAGEALPGIDDEPCQKMRGMINHWCKQIEEDATAHDKVIGAHWNLPRVAAEGHPGLNKAMKETLDFWIDSVRGRDKRDLDEMRGEVFRSGTGSLRHLRQEINNGNRQIAGECGCNEPELVAALADLDAWGRRLQRAASMEAGRDPDAPPSWAAVDLRAAIRDAVTVVPRVLCRSDGAALLYPGKVHSVHGESESGKSWLALCAAAECLGRGETVLYLDFEDSGASVAGRLLQLGVPEETVFNVEMFRYVHPEINPAKGSDAERRAFVEMIGGTFALAVIDGVTESMTLYGLSGNASDDVAAWHLALPKVIARNTGAAVVCIDHITKDPQTRNRWAQGSQHKMAALDGAAYVIEAESPLAVGQAGRLSVRVAKDRPGRVRGLAGKWRKSDRTQHVADLHLDSTDSARSLWRLELPADAGQATDVEEAAEPGRGKPRRILTWHMEQLSRHLEALMDKESQAADDAAAAKVRALRTRNQIAAVMEAESERRGKGKQRDYWRDALALLVDEEFLQIAEGQRRSHIHNVAKSYRQTDDPLSDKYSGVSADPVRNFRVQLGNAANELDSGSES